MTTNNETIPVTGVTLNKTTLTLTIGDEETLIATIEPVNATNISVSWTPGGDPTIVSVDSEGKVKALSAGVAHVTVITHDGEKTATCIVTVNAEFVPVTGVALNKTEHFADLGDEPILLIVSVQPPNASNTDVMWKSSNDDVATVSEAGLVTFVGGGQTTISATTLDGGFQVYCDVTVDDGTVLNAENIFANGLQIYPNPYTGTIRITGAAVEGTGNKQTLKLQVIDASGAVVHTQMIANADETIHLEYLPAGVYFFRFEKDGKSQTVKVLKE